MWLYKCGCASIFVWSAHIFSAGKVVLVSYPLSVLHQVQVQGRGWARDAGGLRGAHGDARREHVRRRDDEPPGEEDGGARHEGDAGASRCGAAGGPTPATQYLGFL